MQALIAREFDPCIEFESLAADGICVFTIDPKNSRQFSPFFDPNYFLRFCPDSFFVVALFTQKYFRLFLPRELGLPL